MGTLIAEDLLLLLLDDDSGRLTNTTYLDTGIGGALLVELALGSQVEVVKRGGLWSRAKVHSSGATPPADPVLADALRLVEERERTAQDLVGRLGKRRRESLLERLEASGILRRKDDRVMGLFRRRRWLAVDQLHESDLRRRMGDILLRGLDPDPHNAGLIAVLSAMDLAHKVIDREGLSGRQLKQRARAVADGDWAAKAVKDAIKAAQAAIAGAAVAASAAATSG